MRMIMRVKEEGKERPSGEDGLYDIVSDCVQKWRLIEIG